jgi:biopolymer transport protein TolQ
MVTKMVELYKAERTSRNFIRAFRKEKNPITLFLKRYKFSDSPMYRIYEKSCIAVAGELDPQGAVTDELFMNDLGERIHRLNLRQFDGVRDITERTVSDQALLLEKDVGLLGTAVSTAPFLGLLGTVWGVMEAFAGMGSGAPTIQAVAPGISAALLTTVVGLLVALPSTIGYNIATNKIRSLSVQMDNFGQEYLTALKREFLREDS